MAMACSPLLYFSLTQEALVLYSFDLPVDILYNLLGRSGGHPTISVPAATGWSMIAGLRGVIGHGSQ